jgi:hypothetical protein
VCVCVRERKLTGAVVGNFITPGGSILIFGGEGVGAGEGVDGRRKIRSGWMDKTTRYDRRKEDGRTADS